MANLPQSGRPKKLSMEANSVSGNSAKEVLPKDARIYAKIGQRDQNTSCFSCHLLIFSAVAKCKVFHTLRFTQLFQSFESLFPPNTCLLVTIAIHPDLLLLL